MMLTLPSNPTLADFHRYVTEMVKERGFENETLPQLFMLLLEECGELAKAARKNTNIKSDATSQKFDPALEAADVFIYLLGICNHLGIDLEDAFRKKEEINKQRRWS